MKIEGSASRSGSISKRHGSADPDPHQNVMDQYSSCVSFLTIDGQCTGSPGTGTKFLISKFLITETLYIRAQGRLRGATHPGVSSTAHTKYLHT
jgi:hypothetical protein